MTGWRQHPLVYEINTWTWLRELSGAAGTRITLADVPQPALERIAALGVDGVWLMGVWERSPRARAIAAAIPDLLSEYRHVLPDWTADDIAGSPYAVHRYEVDAALGGREALARLRARLARIGLRLILDFVPNHLAIDHLWVVASPDLFVHATAERLGSEPQNYFARDVAGVPWIFAHGRDPHYRGWTDTVQLDYRRRVTRRAMADALAAVAEQCDGVRCDMAMLVIRDVFVRTWGGEFDRPDEDFWTEAIDRIKTTYPQFAFMAEVYWDLEYRLQQLGFDYTYDKRLYDRLLHGDTESIRAHLRASVDFQRRLTRFVENHDEARAAAAFGPVRSRAAAVLALTMPGMRLVHEGQIEGRRLKLPVQLGRRPVEPADPLMQAHYERLLRALSHPVFHEGVWQLVDPRPAGTGDSSRWFLAHEWHARDAHRLVVVNWSPHQAQCVVPLNLPARAESVWTLRDLLGSEVYERRGDELREPGLYLDMPGYGAYVFEVE